MIHYITSSSFDINSLPGSNYTLIDSSNARKHVYQIEEAPLSITERIKSFFVLFFRSLASLFCCRQDAHLSDQCLLVKAGKQIVILEGDEIVRKSASRKNLTRACFQSIISRPEGQVETPQSPSAEPRATTTPPPASTAPKEIKLALNSRNLIGIPGEVFFKIHLQELNLAFNQLTELPEELGQLRELKTLNALKNNIKTLPQSIGKLVQLETLFLVNNELSTLPKSISKLVNLNVLNLSLNKFEKVPEAIFQLPKGCVVSLKANPLTAASIQMLKERTTPEGYQGPTIHFPEQGNVPSAPTERPLQTVLADWGAGALVDSLATLSDRKKVRLSNCLDKLKPAELSNQGQKALQDKVTAGLLWFAQEPPNTKFKKLAFSLLKQANDDCAGAEEFFNQLLTLKNVAKSASDVHSAKDLIIAMIRSKLLENIAREKNVQIPGSDLGKIYHRYCQALKDELQLPAIETSHPEQDLVNVTDQDIQAAKKEILEATQIGRQTVWLAGNPIWQAMLENDVTFESVQKKCEDEKQQVLAQLDTQEKQEAWHQQFKINSKTIWNPYFLLTEKILFPVR